MKYTITKEFDLVYELKKINISQRALASVAGVNNSFLNLVITGKRVMAGKTADKVFQALEKIKNDEELQKKLRAITRTSNKGGGKLNPEQRLEIIQRRQRGESLRIIGNDYGVSKETIRNVVKDDVLCKKYEYKKRN